MATSASEARSLGFLHESDQITMNRERLLADAKLRALELLRSGYEPPQPRVDIPAPGENVLAALRLALGALLVHKGRSMLTSLGIVIGTGAVIAMVSAAGGAREKLDERLENVGKGLILIRPGSRTQHGTLAGTPGPTTGGTYGQSTYITLRRVAANTEGWRRADIGAANGHATARGVRDLLRVVSLGGEAGGVRLLSAATIGRIFDVQADGVDLVLGIPLRFGIGFGITPSGGVPWLPGGRICFWGGWGGSMIVCDLDRRLTIAYVMNRMGAGIVGSTRAEAYLREIYASVGATV